MKNIGGKKSIHNIFMQACKKNFLSYGMFLLKENKKIDIHANNEYVFRLSCGNGHIQMANW